MAGVKGIHKDPSKTPTPAPPPNCHHPFHLISTRWFIILFLLRLDSVSRRVTVVQLTDSFIRVIGARNSFVPVHLFFGSVFAV